MQTINRKIPPATFDFTEISEINSPFKEHRLVNQIPVYACHVPGSAQIEVIFLFNAGSAKVNKRGQASAVSHMLCDLLDEWALAEEDRAGSSFDVYASTYHCLDYSRVEFTILGSQLEAILPTLYSRLFEVEFSPEGYASYKESIEEMMKEDGDPEVIGEAIEDALYGKGHPFKDADWIDAGDLALEDVQAFYKERHQQGQVRICIIGDLPDNVLGLLDRQFGSLPNSPNGKLMAIPSFGDKQPTKFGIQLASKDKRDDRTMIQMSTVLELTDRLDFWGVAMTHYILSNGKDSRLERVNQRFRWFKFLRAEMKRKLHFLQIDMDAGVPKTSVSDAIREMRDALLSLCEEEVSVEELQRAKSGYIAQILKKNDGGMAAAEYWEREIRRGYDPEYLNKGLAVLKSLTPQDIAAIARKHFDPRKFFLATIS